MKAGPAWLAGGMANPRGGSGRGRWWREAEGWPNTAVASAEQGHGVGPLRCRPRLDGSVLKQVEAAPAFGGTTRHAGDSMANPWQRRMVGEAAEAAEAA